jgi:hypothetical protein
VIKSFVLRSRRGAAVDQHQHGGPRALPGPEPRLLTHLRPCLLAPPPYEELPGVLAVLYTHARMYSTHTVHIHVAGPSYLLRIRIPIEIDPDPDVQSS